ncbi:TetR/AcrR family transcriptional regulator [Micromonospora krabiensis]|uniref:Transcriptional regulator, TetR family n=1 Tax=Micromonospora krabiensis TaxID=307121 RepID=A0A1C3N338_9ACTN|nr:TetR/AcrR family transcriptional regulator [Micromonospora krabiensis]SBV27012.1 transcriptional regulator, TetR family [Micromonospora krabiensis]
MPNDRGRPRRPETDAAILGATIDLLRETGYGGLSIEAVATRARVTRPTIYRRWPDKAQLVVEALSRAVPPAPAPDTGDTRTDLHHLANGLVDRLVRTGLAPVVLGVLADSNGRDDLAAPLRDLYLHPRLDTITDVVNRGIARGDLPRDTSPDTARDLLAGPLVYRWLVSGTLTHTDIDHLVDTAWTALSRPARSASPRRRSPQPG